MCARIQEVVLSPTASSYNMAQLSDSTEYNVKLQAIAGPQRSRHVTTVFTTSKDRKKHVHANTVSLLFVIILLKSDVIDRILVAVQVFFFF